MKDLAIFLENRPGALAEMGEALARSGVSIEGGGAWVAAGAGIAHFLFEDAKAARQALEAAGINDDCCHFNQAGIDLMSQSIAAAILAKSAAAIDTSRPKQ